MIKFFRRIRQKILTKNKPALSAGKFSKYAAYATGEILLVVVGILIALQVNNSNQQRLDKKKEYLILEEIHTEFTFNKVEMEETQKQYSLAKDDAKKIIALFPINPKDIDLDRLATCFSRITFNPSFDVSKGSIESLKYASSFEIISDAELRTLLLRFDDLVEDYADRESRSKNFSIDYLDPYLRLHLPSPVDIGIKDPRIDLSFLATIEFENLIKERLQKIQNFTQILEDPERPLVKSVNRIIELSRVE